METFTALKLLHGVSTLLLFVSAIALLVVVIRRWRAGDKNLSGGVVQRPWSYVWALMGLCLLALPVSGWFLVHLAGWPLSQIWLLAGSCLYLLGSLSWLWLVVRLNRLRLGRMARYPWFTLVLAIFCAVCFIAIAGLMGAKPV
ncbi:DUF2269 family protein [Pseudomonas sp. FSL R10-0056]|uniref:Membrane protein n=1 Tax=Pseudomonas fragi TaxID=296 RepID=A0A266NRA3_PSEFR|nr:MULTISPECIES: DUF2269 family protein [Pseudomonas]MDN5407238.1 DUF2269 domain-containing protein [Pseudomonas sp.]MDN5449243.1 DUF2269 domain-containing protein [Pseudomonas sp.]MDN5455998.1 DUF2269 domain-containing protein [Pseudomonas sp.]MDN5459199.1 DUF2269 domain-containing protein [Pseudomonas sp.]MDN5497995.1 DUF2269 domain-containing protein [Pseudomonas sp.]